MRVSLTVQDLLTEVGTLVGMYDNEYLIDSTSPSVEQVYCSDLGNNGHTNDSLEDRWVVLRTSDGTWTQRKIASYNPSSNILQFQHSQGSGVIFRHSDSVLHLFDRAAPELALRTIIPAISAQSHLANFKNSLTLDLKALHREYLNNKNAIHPAYANTNYRMVDLQGVTASIAISNLRQVLGVRALGDEIPFNLWDWEFYGHGELAENGILRINSGYLTLKVDITYTQPPSPTDFGIEDWTRELVSVEPIAKECIKYHCAARWMQASLPARDENGWEYAKRTETHFRNRAAELDVVQPHTLR